LYTLDSETERHGIRRLYFLNHQTLVTSAQFVETRDAEDLNNWFEKPNAGFRMNLQAPPADESQVVSTDYTDRCKFVTGDIDAVFAPFVPWRVGCGWGRGCASLRVAG
jgi:hypothetical protein